MGRILSDGGYHGRYLAAAGIRGVRLCACRRPVQASGRHRAPVAVAAVAVCLRTEVHGGGTVRGAGAGGGAGRAFAPVFARKGGPGAAGGRKAALLRGHARMAAHRSDRAAAHPFHLPAIHAHAARGGRGAARGTVHLRRPLFASGHRHGPAGERLSAGVHAHSGRIAGLSLFDGRALGLHALPGHGTADGVYHPRQFDDGAGVSGLHPAWSRIF